MRAKLAAAALLAAGLLVSVPLGCRSRTCDDSSTCGFGEVCDAGMCVVRTCTTSAQCGLGEHCTAEGACAPGCAVDGDCRAGEACDATSGACEARACEDTRLDCGFREWCDAGTGACVDAGDPYCLPCTQDAQCGEGNLCVFGAYCGVDCSADGLCPGGFDCAEVTDNDGVTHQMCVAACWMVEAR